ncbi:hypothetical protein [Neorhizobium alkalisoli]|uniref:hypothetical protein n=1 Tax=Neorhizobium alkalisoli TaxID=528178 RepID=UPI000CF9E77D|nr:hypothetical protein [Neorhizobium alkalisoli]
MKKGLFALAAVTILALSGGSAFAAKGGNGGGVGGGVGGGKGHKGAPVPIAALGLPLAAGLFAYVVRKNSKN